MNSEVITALAAFLGTVAGSLGGVVAAARLTNFRLKKLEEKVDKHNSLVERMAVCERDIKSAHKRIDEVHRAV